MRRTTAAAVAGIALIFAGGLWVVDRLTSDDTTERAPAPVAASPAAGPDPGTASQPAAPAPGPLVPPDDPAPAPAAAPGPVPVTPALRARLAESASHVNVTDRLDTFRAYVKQRCGALALRAAADPADPLAGLDGEAVLLLDLDVSGDQARVTGSKILSQGTVRPALTACAQYALRRQVLPASDLPAGARSALAVTVVVSMEGGSGGDDPP